MIIPAIGPKTLAEYADQDEVLVIESPGHCPCSGTLNGNGSYERTVLQDGCKVPVTVKRFECQSCGTTFSALYTFLLPYKRQPVQAYNEPMKSWAAGASCAVAAWSDDSLSASTVCRLVTEAAEEAPVVAQELQELCVEGGVAPPNAEGAVSIATGGRKEQQQKLLRLGLKLVEKLTGSFSVAVFFWRKRVPGHLRNGLVYRLSAPQSLRHALF